MKSCLTVCLVPFALGAWSPALASPGDLDPGFGAAGRVFVDIDNDDDLPGGAALLPDGRIIVGRGNTNPLDDFSLLRFRPDGSFDTSFDLDGRTSLDIPGVKGTTVSVLLQPDGKVIAIGWSRESNTSVTRLGLVRYLANGAPDPSFGSGGWVTSDVRFDGWKLSALLQPDGRVVVAGHVYVAPATASRIALARFNADGSLDRSFGQDGYSVRNIQTTEWVSTLVRQADGRLLLFTDAATTIPDSLNGWQPTILRFHADGSLDVTFGVDGRVPLIVDAATSSAMDQPDGKLLVAIANDQYAWGEGYCGVMLARVLPDGLLDDSFGTRGLRELPLGGCQIAGAAMLMEPDGKIVLDGFTSTSSGVSIIDSFDYLVTRVNSAGQLDRSFGIDGQAVLDVGDGQFVPYASTSGDSVVRQADGKLVVITSSIRALVSFGDNNRLVVARLLSSGGSPGLIGIKAVGALVPQNDGRITVRIRRSGGAAGLVSVDYVTSSPTAGFTPVMGTLSWADGDREDKTIAIGRTTDPGLRAAGIFTLSLGNVVGGAGLASREMQLSIDASQLPPVEPAPIVSDGSSSGGGGTMSWAFLLMLALLVSRGVVRRRYKVSV